MFIVAAPAAAAATLNSRKHHLLQQVHRPVLFVALRTSKDELFSPFVVLVFSSCSSKQASWPGSLRLGIQNCAGGCKAGATNSVCVCVVRSVLCGVRVELAWLPCRRSLGRFFVCGGCLCVAGLAPASMQAFTYALRGETPQESATRGAS